MQMEPGFNFSKEFPKLDKGLKFVGPFLAALVVFIAIYGLQIVVFAIIPVDRALLEILKLNGIVIHPTHFYVIIPGIVAVWAYLRPHGSQASYNARLRSTNKDSNVPFYDDPRQPTPHYRTKEDEEQPPEQADE